jgi:GNAT superfamily N-acetyltransferase
MHTHYLGAEEVDAYLKDLGDRLLALNDCMPKVWVPIGPSGIELAERLLDVCPPLDADSLVKVIPAQFDRDNDKVDFHSETKGLLRGQNVMVLDSSIHSGWTMLRVIGEVQRLEPTGVCSYALVLKQGARLVPSFWGVTIGDHDRAYFMLPNLPNNHLLDIDLPYGQVRERATRARPGRVPYFHLKKLGHDDLNRPRVDSGTASLDRATWADRYYDMREHPGIVTYLLEVGSNIVGYVTIEREGERLTLEAVAVDKGQKGRGYGAALVRWAETVARHSRCRVIHLNGIQDKVQWYEKFGYKTAGEALELDGEVYFPMSKRVLSHL